MQQPWVYVGAVGSVGALLGYLIWAAPPSARRTAAALLMANVLAWLAGELALMASSDADTALFTIRLVYCLIALLPFSVHHLVAVLDDPGARRHRLAALVTGAFGILALAGLATDLVVAGTTSDDWGFHRQSGPLFGLFGTLLLGMIGLDVALAAQAARRAPEPLQRLRCQHVLVALSLNLGLGVVDLCLLQPLGFHGHRAFTMPLGVSLTSAGFIYALAGNRLLDVPTALRRSVVYAALLATLLVPCLGLSLLAEQLMTGRIEAGPSVVTAALFCLAGFGFPRLRVTAERTLEQALFGARANDRRLLLDASREVTSVLSLPTLAQVTRTTLARAFDQADATIWLRQAGALLPLEPTHQALAPADADALLAWAEAAADPVVLSEVGPDDTPPALNALRIRGVELVLPLGVKRRTVGLLTVGRQADGRLYTDEDIALVLTLANQVAIALENARLYEDLRESREQVSQASRLSAVGTLAAGIAHEIRNPLVAVRTFLQLFPDRKHDAAFVEHFHALSLRELERISTLIGDLLTFARSHERTITRIDLAEVVHRVAQLLNPEAVKRGVSLMVSCAETLPAVQGDADQLQQAILNVALNAVEASPQAGTVTIVVQPARTLAGEAQVRVEIVDQGAGVAREHREAIFTPFFTTKEGATGLGLAVAHELVAEHGGSLVVGSAAGGGASFAIVLPLAGELAEESYARPETSSRIAV
jgi:signal transduction histidine kinase